jgi:hypothetical protein
VGYLVEDNLLYFPKAAIFNQVATYGNSPCSKVTLTSSINCPIESKRVIDQAMLNE